MSSTHVISQQVDHTPIFTNAVKRTLQDKLSDIINVKDFGAVGDGVTDDTAAIQAAVNSLSSGQTVTGLGATFVVTSVNLKSNMIFENFKFITKAGSVNGVSPVTVGNYSGETSVNNIIIRNVNVDGNRVNQTSVDIPTFGEDGGRHGFRMGVTGKNYPITNLLIENCTATNCASYGLLFFAKPSTNVMVKNCNFTWNRCVGVAAYNLYHVFFENCRFDNNGLTVGTSSGALAGQGFDLETYGVGFESKNITFLNCTALQNANSGMNLIEIASPLTTGFIITDNIKFIGCEFDAGIGAGPPTNSGLILTSNIGTASDGARYQNISIVDCKISNMTLRAVNGANISGGSIYNSGLTYLGTLDNSSNIIVNDVNRNGLLFFSSLSTVQYMFSPADPTRVTQGIRTTMTPGMVLDLGLTRVTTQAMLQVHCIGNPSGGSFAALIYLNSGTGVSVSSIYNGAVVTTGATTLQIVNTGTNWQIKSNAITNYDIVYSLMR